MLREQFLWFAQNVIYVLIGEIAVWICIKKEGRSYKFRFARIGNLRPYASFFKIALFVVLAGIFVVPTFDFIMGPGFRMYLETFPDWKLVVYCVGSLAFTILSVMKYGLNKGSFNKEMALLLLVSILSAIAVIWD